MYNHADAERPSSPSKQQEQQCQYHALAQQSYTRIRPDHPDTCYGDSAGQSSQSAGGSEGKRKNA